MVYNEKTLEPCHSLTEVGEKEYRLMLEMRADEILYMSKHPLKYWAQRIYNFFKYGDSEWHGANYSETEKYKDGYSYVK